MIKYLRANALLKFPYNRFAAEKKSVAAPPTPPPINATTESPEQSKMKKVFTSSLTPEDMAHISIPVCDLMIKHYRKFYLEQSVIDFKKIVVEAKRMRTLDDHLKPMIQKNEVACVIEGREEFNDIDIVIDRFQLSSIKRRVHSSVSPVYIRLPIETEDNDIRCVLKNVSKHPTHNVIFKVQFQRYIVGRPNLLFLPIQLEENYYNESIMRGTNIQFHVRGLWVYSYNNIYPTYLRVDPRYITQERPYKIGDLVNTFPDGIELHERYAKLIHRNIATLEEDEDDRQLQQVDARKNELFVEKLNTDEKMLDMDEQQEQEDDEKKPQKEKKEKKKIKERSLKKIIAKESTKFKADIMAAQQEAIKRTETKKKEKGDEKKEATDEKKK